MERRFISAAVGEVRASKNGDGTTGIRGLGIVFDSPATIAGEFDEIVRSQAVDGLLDSDIRGLYNHDVAFLLARNGTTMSLRKTSRGVEYDIPALPKSRADVAEAIARRDVTGNSFSFALPADGSGERWTRAQSRTDGGKRPLREIVRFEAIYDIGPVVFPAYSATTVSARSLELARSVGRTDADRRRLAAQVQVEIERDRWRQTEQELRETARPVGRENEQGGEDRPPLSWTPSELGRRGREVACHEAAHALAAHLAGYRVQSIRVEQGGGGFCRYDDYDATAADPIIRLAGPAASAVFRGRSLGDPALGLSLTTDAERAMVACGGDPHAYRGAQREAEQFVRRRWWSIERMADVLVATPGGVLEGSALQRAIREAL